MPTILGLAKSSLREHKVKAASIWTAHRFTSPQYCTCENFATRFRIGELSEVQTKSSALGHCCKSQVSLDSGKDNPAKRLTSSNWSRNAGHPTGLDAASWMPIRIHRDKCHGSFRATIWTTQLDRWGRAVGPALNKRHLINVFQERQRATPREASFLYRGSNVGELCLLNLHKPEVYL